MDPSSTRRDGTGDVAALPDIVMRIFCSPFAFTIAEARLSIARSGRASCAGVPAPGGLALGLILLGLSGSACSDDAAPPDAAIPDAGGPRDASFDARVAFDAGWDSSIALDAGRDSAVSLDAGADAGDAAIDPDAGREPDCTEEPKEILRAGAGDPGIKVRSLVNFGDHWLVFLDADDPAMPGADYPILSVDRDGHVMGSATLRTPGIEWNTFFLPLSFGGAADELAAVSGWDLIRYRHVAGVVTAFGDGLRLRIGSIASDPASSTLYVVNHSAPFEHEWIAFRPDDAAPGGLAETRIRPVLAGVSVEAEVFAGPESVLAEQSHDGDITIWGARILPDRSVVPLPAFEWIGAPGWIYYAFRDPAAPRWLMLMKSWDGDSVHFYAFDDGDPPTAPVLLATLVTPADGFRTSVLRLATDQNGTSLFAVHDLDPSTIIFRTTAGELFREGTGPYVEVAAPADPTDFRFAAVYALEVDPALGVRRLGFRCIELPPAAP
jgi:hypothetical protein